VYSGLKILPKIQISYIWKKHRQQRLAVDKKEIKDFAKLPLATFLPIKIIHNRLRDAKQEYLKMVDKYDEVMRH